MRSKIYLLIFLFAFSLISCDKEEITNDSLTIENRDPDGCETAFAYEKDQCFYEFNDSFKRWGWVIGPLSAPYNDIHEL